METVQLFVLSYVVFALVTSPFGFAHRSTACVLLVVVKHRQMFNIVQRLLLVVMPVLLVASSLLVAMHRVTSSVLKLEPKEAAVGCQYL